MSYLCGTACASKSWHGLEAPTAAALLPPDCFTVHSPPCAAVFWRRHHEPLGLPGHRGRVLCALLWAGCSVADLRAARQALAVQRDKHCPWSVTSTTCAAQQALATQHDKRQSGLTEWHTAPARRRRGCARPCACWVDCAPRLAVHIAVSSSASRAPHPSVRRASPAPCCHQVWHSSFIEFI